MCVSGKMNQFVTLALIFATATAAASAFSCQREGLFSDPEDSKSFYVCTQKADKVIQGKLTCGPNTQFDPTTGNCAHPNARFMPVGRSLLTTTVPEGVVCKRPGFKCLSCNALVLCVGVSGGFQTIPVLNGTCTDGLVCDDGVGCVPSKYCSHREFECSDEGYFPDPYDCQLFHVCTLKGLTMIHEVRSCETFGTAYDPLINRCGASIWSTNCVTGRPVPPCKNHFEVGALPSNPHIYYVCIVDEATKTISPKMFQCPGGKTFNETLTQCEDSP